MTHKEVLSQEDFDTIRSYLYDVAGITLADHKRQMAENRINKRIQTLNLSGFSDYVGRLKGRSGQDEIVNLVNALTTNVTHFFREGHHFDHLRDQLKAYWTQAPTRSVRLWSAGCSIGAEPYSAAITIYDLMQDMGLKGDAKMLATDIDTLALARARKAEFHDKNIKGLPKDFLDKHFVKSHDDGETVYTVKDYLRRMIAYNYLNLNEKTWPMSKQFDFIFCRNVLIYFNREKQKEYIGKMTRLLKPGGFLYLGHSEHAVMEGQGYEICGQTIYKKPLA